MPMVYMTYELCGYVVVFDGYSYITTAKDGKTVVAATEKELLELLDS